MDGKSRPCVDNTSPGLVSTGGGGCYAFTVRCPPWLPFGQVMELWEVEPSWRKWLSGRRALRSAAELTSCPAVLPGL